MPLVLVARVLPRHEVGNSGNILTILGSEFKLVSYNIRRLSLSFDHSLDFGNALRFGLKRSDLAHADILAETNAAIPSGSVLRGARG